MNFVWTVAWRLLREGRFQTALILAGVSIGVGVIVYITAIVSGLQANIIDRTLSTQAHVVLRPADIVNQAPLTVPGSVKLADIAKRTQHENTIANWSGIVTRARGTPNVSAVAAMASGPGVAQQGGVRKSIVLMGVELDDYSQVVRLDNKLQAGRLLLPTGTALIGKELAADLGLQPGGRLRLQTATGGSQSMTVGAILDFGLKDLNKRWVLLPLREAQNLLGFQRDITEIYVKSERLFEAESLAANLALATGLTADSWQSSNGQLVTALKSQTASSLMIRVFVTFAVALGIASVLVVTVVQRQREIGILRAMGTPASRILAVFLLQGGLVGLFGSLFGSLLGAVMAEGISRLAKTEDGSPLFPVVLDGELFITTALIATLVGVLAALLPALRAARLDPVVAIRG
ncbi:ABC transporter permease [Vogesella indigofera]|uniref:ABC transporter permease n=1 Tax=Vogesella indigofera TaxID=45465 RepID=UPI00234FA85C|nr:FtsX-like permease family protein [Vogesella indigofera]MDC7700489.1 FtsX-like permease family protein [Vogesella indigofera]